MPAPIKIQTPWVGVNLNGNTTLRTGSEYHLNVNVVARPPQQLPAGHMPKNSDEGIGDSAQDAFGLLLSTLPKPAVNARDDEVKAKHNVVGIVERPIGQNIGFDPLEDPEFSLVLHIQPVSLVLLLLDFLDRQSAGVVRRL